MHERNAEATKTAVDLGFNYRGLLKIMSNEQPVTLDQLNALADYFEIDIVHLIREPIPDTDAYEFEKLEKQLKKGQAKIKDEQLKVRKLTAENSEIKAENSEIKKANQYTSNEKELIELYRKLDPDMSEFIYDVLQHAVSFKSMHTICKAFTKMEAEQRDALETSALAFAATDKN